MNPNDIDTWIEDPGGNRVWFRQREGGMMHLDRDDRGLSNDSIVVNGQQVVNPLNQEVVTIQRLRAGRVCRQRLLLRQQGRPAGARSMSRWSRSIRAPRWSSTVP